MGRSLVLCQERSAGILEPHLWTEAQWQSWVLDHARLTGWLAYHTHDSRRSQAGFPDLVLIRPPRIIFAELKTARGKMSDEQDMYARLLGLIPGVEYFLWRPSDYHYVEEILKRGRADRHFRYWLDGVKG